MSSMIGIQNAGWSKNNTQDANTSFHSAIQCGVLGHENWKQKYVPIRMPPQANMRNSPLMRVALGVETVLSSGAP